MDNINDIIGQKGGRLKCPVMHNVIISQIKMLNTKLVHFKASVALKIISGGFCVKLPLNISATLDFHGGCYTHRKALISEWLTYISFFFQELHFTQSTAFRVSLSVLTKTQFLQCHWDNSAFHTFILVVTYPYF